MDYEDLTIFLISLFSLPLALNAQSVDEMLQKVSAAIEAGQNGQAVSYFRADYSSEYRPYGNVLLDECGQE